MSVSPSEVEQIVRAVIQRLGLSAAPTPTAEHSPTALRLPPTVPEAQQQVIRQASGSLVLGDRLVTLATLEGKLEGISTLCVEPKTVVTPAVSDELRARKIRLERRSSSQASPRLSSQDKRLLIVAQPLLQTQLSSLAEFTAGTRNCAADVRRIAAHFSSGGEYAVWCSMTPYAAARAAAGNGVLRAVQLLQLDELDRACREADPNVFIVDEKTWDTPPLQTLATSLHRRLV